MISVGDRVSVSATVFDGKDNAWSISQFGEQWRTARCYGTVKTIIKNKSIAIVRWEIDDNETRIAISLLKSEKKSGKCFSFNRNLGSIELS